VNNSNHKACINQTAIETDLQCLPVFLAGCDTLLILAGKTYTQRLWCVLEIFVFLRMGGTLDRVVVVPINMDSEAEAKGMLDIVDVAKGKCYLESDQQRLLGIIESGFGSFDAFNEVIRTVFHQGLSQLTTYNTDSAGGRSARSLLSFWGPGGEKEGEGRHSTKVTPL